MKRLRFLPALLLILGACSEQIIGPGDKGPEKEGSILLGLTAHQRTEAAGTKADAELPNVDDFRVAIYKNPGKVRLYNDSYANTKDKAIKLNAGQYYIVAQHGDTLGCGFDKPYYMADTNVDVTGHNTPVALEAKLSNVKLAVQFDRTITDVYNEYYAVVKHKKYSEKKVRFEKGETRCGYIPAGEMVLQIYVLEDFDGQPAWKYHESGTFTYNPNDFVSFYVTTKDGKGDIVVNITVDTSVDRKETEISIPSYVTPQEAPSINLTGFDGAGNVHSYTEGFAAAEGTMVHFVARGGIRNCILKIKSDYLTSKGIPTEVDLANLVSDQEQALKSFGLEWSPDLLTSRNFNYIDFSGLVADMLENLKASGQDMRVADFTLKVVDSVNKSAEVSFGITSLGIQTSLDIKNYNVWAKKIYTPVATATRGNMALLKLQTSTDGSDWTDVTVAPSLDGMTHTYEYIPVEPATRYYLRSIYNNNPACSSPVVEVTTEAAAQLGNSGFEDYQMVTTSFTPMGGAIGGGKYNRNWYLPYTDESNAWWACNSRQSMPDGHTGWTSTWCKNFPSSGFVTDKHSGSKAALLYCVNVGNGTTDDIADGKTYEGELWIGKADNSGNRTQEGHSFSSRPSKLTFWYKYAPTDNRRFFVDAWVKDAAGNIIASAQETNGPEAAAWTQHSLDFTYSVRNAKAAQIFVRISSSYGDGAVNAKQSFSLGNETVTAHAGCFLKIDDIELVYE